MNFYDAFDESDEQSTMVLVSALLRIGGSMELDYAEAEAAASDYVVVMVPVPGDESRLRVRLSRVEVAKEEFERLGQ